MPDDETHVEPQDERLRNSPKAESKSKDVAFAQAGDQICYWNDKKYSDGSTVCDSHRRYECWNGKWADIGNC